MNNINQQSVLDALVQAYRSVNPANHTANSFRDAVDTYMFEWVKGQYAYAKRRSDTLQSLQWHALFNITDNQEIHISVNQLEAFCNEMRLKVKDVLKLSEGTIEKLEVNGQVWRRANRIESQFVGRPWMPRKAQDSPEFILQRQKELKDQQARQRVLDEKAYKSPPAMKPIKTYTAPFH